MVPAISGHIWDPSGFVSVCLTQGLFNTLVQWSLRTLPGVMCYIRPGAGAVLRNNNYIGKGEVFYFL